MAASKPLIRQANLQDCDAIINIDSQGEIYDGLDYIPQTIRILLQDKASNSLVVEIDGKIVAFRNMHVVEDGTKAISMAARTLPAYRQKGFFKEMSKSFIQTLPKKYPKLRSVLYTKHQPDPPSADGNWIIKENYFTQHTTVDALRSNLNGQPLMETGRSSILLSPEKAMKFLTDDTIMQKFFNQQYIIAYTFWWPIKPTKQGLRILALRHNVVASCSNFSVTLPISPQDVTAISFSDLTQGVSKFCLDLYFHGNEVTLLKDHIVTHLRKVVGVIKKAEFGLKLHFPLTMKTHRDEIKSFLKEVFNSPNTWGLQRYVIGQELPLNPSSNL